MSIAEDTQGAIRTLIDDQKALVNRVNGLELTIEIIKTERKHMNEQVDTIRDDVKGLSGTFSKVAWTIIGTILVAMITFAMKGGLIQ